MKRLLLTAALVAMVTSLALAQSVGFGAHGNFTISKIPPPDITGGTSIKDAYGLGLGGGAHLDISLIAFSFRLSADYIHYAVDVDKFREAYRPLFGNAVNQMNIDGGALGIYSVTINSKMSILPIPILTPYITAGIGLAWLNRDEAKTSIAGVGGATIPASNSSQNTIICGGAGADLKLGVKLFAEVKYCLIFTEGTNSSYVPITIGITF
jgi:opacity protein-like surface antigen